MEAALPEAERCPARTSQGSLGNLGIVGTFFDFSGIFLIFCHILRFFVKIMCFLSFSSKNHEESFINFVKILFWDPKRAKFDQKSEIGHVRTCQDLFY